MPPHLSLASYILCMSLPRFTSPRLRSATVDPDRIAATSRSDLQDFNEQIPTSTAGNTGDAQFKKIHRRLPSTITERISPTPTNRNSIQNRGSNRRTMSPPALQTHKRVVGRQGIGRANQHTSSQPGVKRKFGSPVFKIGNRKTQSDTDRNNQNTSFQPRIAKEFGIPVLKIGNRNTQNDMNETDKLVPVFEPDMMPPTEPLEIHRRKLVLPGITVMAGQSPTKATFPRSGMFSDAVSNEENDRKLNTKGKAPLNPNAGKLKPIVLKTQVLCGFPPYNDREACIQQDYYIDPLFQCENSSALILFACIAMLLGLVTVCINSVIPIVVLLDSGMRSQYYGIKASLAIADMISGILVLAAVLPHVFKFRYMTEAKLVEYVHTDTNSPVAIIAGALLTVSKQASLLHLMFLSIERFVAIKWSVWHMKRSSKTVAAILVGIWTVSVTCAFTPAAFAEYFQYQFQPPVLMHMMTLRSSDVNATALDWCGPVYASITIFAPYTITVVFCVLTGIVSYRKLRSSAVFFRKKQARGGQKDFTDSSSIAFSINSVSKSRSRKRRLQPEIAVFLTLLIMVTAFTITLLSFTIVVIMVIAEVLTCSNYTIPYVVSFYIGMLNSVANGLIYSVRDKRFRSSVGKLVSSALICRKSTHATRQCKEEGPKAPFITMDGHRQHHAGHS